MPLDAQNDESNVVSIDARQLEDAKSRFKLLHSRIFGNISEMLRKARLMPLHKLSEENPSFVMLVDELIDLRATIKLLAPQLELTSFAEIGLIDQYIGLAHDLAVSIESECHDSLGAAVAALDEQPYI